METYTITADPNPADHTITLFLNGKLSEEALPELELSIARARCSKQQILIDLSEVTLVDRKTVDFLSQNAKGDIQLVNCPNYLRRWIQGGRS